MEAEAEADAPEMEASRRVDSDSAVMEAELEAAGFTGSLSERAVNQNWLNNLNYRYLNRLTI